MKILVKKDYKFFVIISIVFLCFIGLNYYFNYELLKDNIRRYESGIFSRVHTKIEDWTNSNFKDVEKIARLLQNEHIQNAAQIQPLLHKFQQSSNFPYLIMGLDDGSFYISDLDYVTPHNYDLKSRDWYNDTLKAGGTIASNPYISMRLGLRSVSICTPINLIHKRGVFCGGQPFEVIRSYFKEYQTLYDKNLYLINKGGEILASFGNLNDTISFENVNLPNDKYMAISIKNTNWSIVFEKDQELYTNELNKYLLINLLLYALCVLIYVFTNFLWLRKNSVSSKQLNEQNIYIKDVLTKQVNGIFISCNENLDIIYAGDEFANFYDFYDGGTNLKEAIKNSKFLSDDAKLNLLNEITVSSQSSEFRYFNIEFSKENDKKKYLITTAPIGDHAPYGLSFLFQDVSLIQEQEPQKAHNELYNPYVEKLMIFIKQNIGDDGLCVEKLAKIGGYSKFHLQRLFKNYTNTNIAEYLRQFRLERARFLLKFSDEKISVIAKKCGFSHNETFIRLFSKIYGSSPVSYRQNARGKISQKELLYEEVELSAMKLAITHKFQNIEFLRSKQSSGNMLVLLENGDINSKIYAVCSKDSSLSYVELSGGTWAKVDVKTINLPLEDILDKACEVFYDPNLYKFKAPQIYFSLMDDKNIDFIYFKI